MAPFRSLFCLLLVVVSPVFGQTPLKPEVDSKLPAEISQALAKRQYDQAVPWLTEQALGNHARAALEMGKLHRLGKGVPADRTKSITFFHIAAEQGLPQAQYMLGVLLSKTDAAQARLWFDAAAVQGHQNAANRLVRLGKLDSLSPKRAIEQGVSPGDVDLASMELEPDAPGATALLVTAVRRQSDPWVKYLLDQGFDANASDKLGNTLLHHAVRQKNSQIIRLLLNNGADPNRVSNDGSTPLHVAISTADVACVQLLLTAGANKQTKNKSGWSPNMLAERSADSQLAKLMGLKKQSGTQSSSRSMSGGGTKKMMLNEAVRRGKVKRVAQLIDQGVAVDEVDAKGRSTISYAIEENHDQIAQMLLNAGASVDLTLPGRRTLLHLAAANGNKDQVALIVNHTNQLDVRDKHGTTPLIEAVRVGCSGCVTILLRAGASNAMVNKVGETALILAAKVADPDIGINIANAGVGLDLTDASGRSALWWASKYGRVALVKKLLKRKVPRASDIHGLKPLHIAVQGGKSKVFEALLTNSNPNLKTKAGNTALMLAAQNNESEIVGLLLRKQAKLNLQNLQGDTALIGAIRSDAFEAASLLIAAGANPNVKNDQERSAISLAATKQEARWQNLLASRPKSGFLELIGSALEES